MRAVTVSPAARSITVREHHDAELRSPIDVLVHVFDVGICGTDHEIASFKYGTPPAGDDYLVIGHEAFGRVVEVGSAVARIKAGDMVVPMVRRPCPHEECAPCRNGRQDFCATGDFRERGIKGLHGYMTERIVDHERYFVTVPSTLREAGVLVEPLSIAEKALEQIEALENRLPEGARHTHVQPKTAVVLGAGPVGLLGSMLLRAAGYRVLVYSSVLGDVARIAILNDIGATPVATETNSVEYLAEVAGEIDLVYEATGASTLSFEVLKYLGVNGTFVFTGVPGRKTPVKLDTDRVMRQLVLRNQVLLGTVNAGRSAYESAVRDLATFAKHWPEAVAAMLTARVTLDDAPALLARRSPGIKFVVSPDAI
jgi:threonine dehydrogenase-like Zn-dependent dehydrogenase